MLSVEMFRYFKPNCICGEGRAPWDRKNNCRKDNLLLDFGYIDTECTVFRVSHILLDTSPAFVSTLYVKKQCPEAPTRACAIVCSPFLCQPSQRKFRLKNNALCCWRRRPPRCGESGDLVPFRTSFLRYVSGGGKKIK